MPEQQEFPSDFAGEGIFEEYPYIASNLYKIGQWVDEWNCKWTVLKDGFLGQVTGHPLEDLDMLMDYSWPEAGSQISLMINPSIWRELFLPAYTKMFQRIREAGKHVFFHTDGYTIDILPDLVEAGANVFWADLTVNPLDVLRDRLGGKVCFLGLTDVQFIMRWGTTADVEKHGKDLI